MRPFVVALSIALSCATAEAQTPIRLELAGCDGLPQLTFDAMARTLRVELRAIGVDASFERDESSASLSVRVERCTRPARVEVVARRGSRERSRPVDLRDVHDAVAVRTLALVLVDLWSSLPASTEASEPARAGPGWSRALSDPHGLSGAGRVTEPLRRGRRLSEPRVAVANESDVDRTHRASNRTEERSLSIVALAGFDGSTYLDGPGFVAGGRLGVSVRHEGGFFGRLGVSLQGTHGVNTGSDASILAPGVDLQAGGEATFDGFALALSAGLRAGFVAAFVSEAHGGGSPELSGILDVTVTVRLRIPLYEALGLEVESGVGYAAIGYPGTWRDGLLAWRDWWIPVRVALTATLY